MKRKQNNVTEIVTAKNGAVFLRLTDGSWIRIGRVSDDYSQSWRGKTLPNEAVDGPYHRVTADELVTCTTPLAF